MNHKPKFEYLRRLLHRSCHICRAASFFLVALGALLLFTPAIVRADAPPHPTVLRADATGVTLRWEFPAMSIAEKTVAGVPFSVLMMDSFPTAGTPGTPNLPRAATLVGLPPAGNATVAVTGIQTETIPLPAPPIPAPAFDAVGNPPQSVEIIAADKTIYGRDMLFPAESVLLAQPVQIRRQRVARLTVNPVRVNPAAGTAIVLRTLTVRVDFSNPPPAVPYRTTLTDPIVNALAASLANPQSVQWQLPRTPRQNLSAQTAISATKIVVAQTGIIGLTCADLQAAGLPTDTLDPHNLQVTTGYPRQNVAFELTGTADGHCDPADRLTFFAEPTFSRTTDDGVYFVSAGDTVFSAAAVQDDELPFKVYLPLVARSFTPVGNLPSGAAIFTATAEENRIYDELYADRLGDRWFWQKLNALGDRDMDISLTLAAPRPENAVLTVYFQGTFESEHHVRVQLNGHAAGEAVWSDKNAFAFETTVPGSWLADGRNTISLALTDTIGDVWVDAAQLVYSAQPTGGGQLLFTGESTPHAYRFGGWQNSNPVVLDVTDPLHAKPVKNYVLAEDGTLSIGDEENGVHRYFVAAETAIAAPKSIQPALNLPDPPEGADYIIIAHPDFLAAVAPLAAHRAAQGLRVETVDVRAIYDTFGDGRVSAAAIKTFLAHAFSNWTPPSPVYVLLVGDGHYDFKNYLGWGNPNFIPPYLAAVDPRSSYPWVAETAADNRYVTLTGSDNFPDMMIGRLPVNSAAETQTVVDKIIGYETDNSTGGWRDRQLLVSDNCDVAGNFYKFNDFIYNNTLSLFSSARFYYPQDPGAPCVYTNTILYDDTASLRSDFLQSFDDGAGMVVFTGHSSWHQWAGGNRTTGAEESVFHWNRNPAENDVLHLTNGTHLPVVLGMTCFTGYFHHPEYPTLDESVLRQPNGGAVAVWGASGVGVATGHDQLQTGFFAAMNDDGERRLGALTLAGKATLYADGFNQDLLDTFTLFGDPAFAINVLKKSFTNFVYLPLVVRDGG